MGPSLYRWYGLSLVYVLAVLINWLGCFMLGIVRSEGLEGSWLADVKVRGMQLFVITYVVYVQIMLLVPVVPVLFCSVCRACAWLAHTKVDRRPPMMGH
jgi:hypothetical protein